jgi:hypothetical protein
MLQGLGEVEGGGSFGGGEQQAGYRNKTWMSGTNMTSEGKRYRGVFVWNHDEATKKLNGCCGEGGGVNA